MLRYANYCVTFREVPDEISLCINISGCKIRCMGCHSRYLWDEIGQYLDVSALKSLIGIHNGISCVCLMGGDHEFESILELGKAIKKFGLKTAWYSGRDSLEFDIDDINKAFEVFDYIKLGRFIESLGGLDSSNTNQRMLKIEKDGVGIYSYKNKEWKYETKNKGFIKGTKCKDA